MESSVIEFSLKNLSINLNILCVAGSGAGVVRVVYKEREQRALLRGMHGAIQDLAFARVPGAVLASIDFMGCLFVHTIDSTPTNLVCTLILQVETDDVSPTSHRVIWCPYIPEDEVSEGDDVSKFLLVTRGSKAELWSVDSVSSLLGPQPIKVIFVTLKTKKLIIFSFSSAEQKVLNQKKMRKKIYLGTSRHCNFFFIWNFPFSF